MWATPHLKQAAYLDYRMKLLHKYNFRLHK
jgi:hypothetical protein